MSTGVRSLAVRVLGSLSLALIAGYFWACSGDSAEPWRRTRGYLLISIDTLRADHLGAYGYDRNTSPFLDSLAERGLVFDNAIVQLPGTLPSHMSMLTGLYPAEHGVYPPAAVLPEEIPTLAELFQRAGFRTGGFTEGGYVSGNFGFARGFEVFSDEADRGPTGVRQTFDRGIQFLDQLAKKDRFFLFLHTYAVHDPYDPPEGYRSLFWSAAIPETFAPTGPNLVAVNRGQSEVTEEAVRYYEALYDAGIRYLDDELQRLFNELGSMGLIDNMTVIITSDHGEEFMEHGKMVHEQIYHELLHVPLLVLHPGLEEGRRVESLVQSIDIAPSFVQLAGLEGATKMSGVSLMQKLDEPRAGGRSEAFAESWNQADRSLYVKSRDRLFQFLLFEDSASGEDGWVTKSVTLNTSVPELHLQVESYHEHRELRIEVNGTSVGTVRLAPGKKEELAIDLSAGEGKQVVVLSTDTCTTPAELGVSDDPRCLSFRLEGVPSRRTELYDVVNDPRAQNDLSFEYPAAERHLGLRLQKYRWNALDGTDQGQLDSELEAELKALGYLQ